MRDASEPHPFAPTFAALEGGEDFAGGEMGEQSRGAGLAGMRGGIRPVFCMPRARVAIKFLQVAQSADHQKSPAGDGTR
jgi:hypothetical protein